MQHKAAQSNKKKDKGTISSTNQKKATQINKKQSKENIHTQRQKNTKKHRKTI
jgi:hypothetical protein